MAVASMKKWDVRTADVTTAFLHAPVQGEAYVRAPPHVDCSKQFWKLKRALYGLRTAPRAWQDHLALKMKNAGWRRLATDSSVYVHKTGNDVTGALVAYVDDIFAAGSAEVLDELFVKLRKELTIKQVDRLGEKDSVVFLGAKYTRLADGFEVDTTEYVKKIIDAYGESGGRDVATPGVQQAKLDEGSDPVVDKSTHGKYRRTVGQLLWLGSVRRDIQFAVKELAKKVHGPTSRDMQLLGRVVRYLRGTAQLKGGVFPTGNFGDIEAHTDSDWGGCQETKKSTSGGIISVGGAVVHSWSRQQKAVALSSGEAEVVALSVAATEAMWVWSLLHELGFNIGAPVLKCDSKAAVDMVSRAAGGRAKHIALKIQFLKQSVEDK